MLTPFFTGLLIWQILVTSSLQEFRRSFTDPLNWGHGHAPYRSCPCGAPWPPDLTLLSWFPQQFRILETAPHAGRVQPITNRTNRLTLFVTYPYIRHYSCSRHWGTGARGLTGGIRSTRCPTPPEDSGQIRSGRWHQNKRTRGRCYRRRRRKHLEHVPWVCHSLNGRAVPRAAVPPYIRGAGCHGLSHLGTYLMSSLGFIMSSVRTNVQWPGPT